LDKKAIFKFLLQAKERGLKAIEVTGGGEPTLHPDFVEIMAFIKERFEFSLVTNGSLLHRDDIQNIVSGAKWIRISIDAGSAATYEKIHRGYLNFSELLNNLKRLKKNNPETILGYSFVVCKNNYHEILDGVRRAQEYGFDNIRFSSIYTYRNKSALGEYEDEIQTRFDLALKEIKDSFDVFVFRDRISEIYHQAHSPRCWYSLLVMVIAASGKIFPCCTRKNEPNSEIGNISMSYDDVYAHRKVVSTKGCPPCWMKTKNDAADYMLLKNPMHVNFI